MSSLKQIKKKYLYVVKIRFRSNRTRSTFANCWLEQKAYKEGKKSFRLQYFGGWVMAS